MAKGGLIIDVLAGPPKGASADDDADDMFEGDEEAAPKGDPEALISGIESKLAQLRALVAGL